MSWRDGMFYHYLFWVEAVKMNLPPRLLFLFQSLPLGIPTLFFNMLDKLISRFIWQNKRPRVKTLTLEKNGCGLSLPNIKYYFWAAQHTAVEEQNRIRCQLYLYPP